MEVKLSLANGEELLCLGGTLLSLPTLDEKGGFRETVEFSYVVSRPVGLIMGQDALIDLGLLPMGFPGVTKVQHGNRGFKLSLLSGVWGGM